MTKLSDKKKKEKSKEKWIKSLTYKWWITNPMNKRSVAKQTVKSNTMHGDQKYWKRIQKEGKWNGKEHFKYKQC